MSASSSDLQLHVRARPLLAQVHHALQLVVCAEAPAALGRVVEGGRLRCQLTTSALACSWGLAQVMAAGVTDKSTCGSFGKTLADLLLWHVSSYASLQTCRLIVGTAVPDEGAQKVP